MCTSVYVATYIIYINDIKINSHDAYAMHLYVCNFHIYKLTIRSYIASYVCTAAKMVIENTTYM